MTAEEARAHEHRGGPSMIVWLAAALLLIGVVAVLAVTFNRNDVPLKAAAATRPSSLPPPPASVESIVFCESFARRADGRVDLRGAFNELALDAFPAKVSFSIVFAVRPQEPGHRYTFAFLHPAGQVIEQPFDAPAGPAATVKVMEVPNMPFAAPGLIRFQVTCDGRPIGDRVVPVTLSGQNGAATQPAAAAQ